jgi:hypothetical protein
MAGTRFELEEEVDNILIGSDPSCRFCLPLAGVSPVHARLWIDRSGATVYDTNSPRGLYVNDDRVNGQLPLRNGDILWLGTPGEDEVVMIQCRLPSRQAEAAPKPMTELPGAVDVQETQVLAGAAYSAAAPEFAEVVEVAEPYVEADPVEREERAVAQEWRRAPSDAEPPTLSSRFDGAGGAQHPPHFEVDIEDTSAGRPALASRAAMPPAPAPDEPEPAYEAETAAFPQPVFASPEPMPPRVHERTPIPAPMPVPAAARPAPTPVPTPAPAPREPAPTPVPRRAPVERASAKTPVPVAAPRPRGGGGGAGKLVGIGLGVVALLAVGGLLAYRQLGAKATQVATLPTPAATQAAPTPVAEPVAVASEAPPDSLPEAPTASPAPVVEEVTIVKSPPPQPSALPSAAPSASARPVSPSPRPGASASPSSRPAAATAAPVAPAPDPRAQAAAQVASLLGKAGGALEAGNHEAAAAHYDEVLKLEPQNARALEGRTRAQAALSAARRTFVAGRTAVKTQAAGKSLSGFDTEDVSLQKAPDFLGRIDFEVSPSRVQPGASYAVKVFVANDGKKPIKIRGVSVKTSVNGATSDAPASAQVKEIAPRQRVLLLETGGEWKGDTNAWALDVEVASDKGDSLKNRLIWR